MDTHVFQFELGTSPPRDKLLSVTLDGQCLCAERVAFQGPAHLTWDLCATRNLPFCWWPLSYQSPSPGSVVRLDQEHSQHLSTSVHPPPKT